MTAGRFSDVTKSGGTITGYAGDIVNGNVVKNTSGVVQNNQGHTAYQVPENYRRAGSEHEIRHKRNGGGMG